MIYILYNCNNISSIVYMRLFIKPKKKNYINKISTKIIEKINS